MKATERPGRGFVADYYLGGKRVRRSFKTAALRDAYVTKAEPLMKLRKLATDGELHDRLLEDILTECLETLRRRRLERETLLSMGRKRP